jgi:hypothetical protein
MIYVAILIIQNNMLRWFFEGVEREEEFSPLDRRKSKENTVKKILDAQ